MLHNSTLNVFSVMLLSVGGALLVFLGLPQLQPKNAAAASSLDSSPSVKATTTNSSAITSDTDSTKTESLSQDNVDTTTTSNNASSQSFGTVKINNTTVNIPENGTVVHEVASDSSNSNGSHISVMIDGSSSSSSTSSGSSTSVSLKSNSKNSVVRIERSSNTADN